MHTVDVRPYLYLLALQCSTDKACRVITATAQEVVDFAVCIAADESLRDVDLVVRIVVQLLGGMLADVVEVRFSIFVRTDEVES